MYGNELDKACFGNDAACSKSKDLAKRTISDKSLKDRAYEIGRNCNYDAYQKALASTVYRFFDKKSETGISVNEQLGKKLHKSVTKNSKEEK